MKELTFSTGRVEFNVNGKRTVSINPADVSFAETLYALMSKLDSIEKDSGRKLDKTNDPVKMFEAYRGRDKKAQEAVDAVFGAGFCADVFEAVSLFAVTDTGLTAVENFLFAVLDEMDETATANVGRRSASIEKYTAKYEKYHQK